MLHGFLFDTEQIRLQILISGRHQDVKLSLSFREDGRTRIIVSIKER